jgi:hypothetical protein
MTEIVAGAGKKLAMQEFHLVYYSTRINSFQEHDSRSSGILSPSNRLTHLYMEKRNEAYIRTVDNATEIIFQL